MLTGEADSNEQELLIRRASRLEYRQYACDMINELFGVNINVSYVEPEQPTDTQSMSGTSGDESGTREPEESNN